MCSPSSLASSSSSESQHNSSSSEDSLTILDDSLTSLQWLQNLNILKPAESTGIESSIRIAPKSEQSVDDSQKKTVILDRGMSQLI